MYLLSIGFRDSSRVVFLQAGLTVVQERLNICGICECVNFVIAKVHTVYDTQVKVSLFYCLIR